MGNAAEQPWRLPGSVKGQDVKLQGGANRTLTPSAKARLQRIVSKTPEVMVKVTGRTRNGATHRAGHLKAHLDYITRNGRLPLQTQDGQRITDRSALRALHDDWLLANAVQACGRRGPNATQSVSLILSMPPGTPADRLEAAATTWARQAFGSHYDWVMARHDDTAHPHVHLAVRAVGRNGRRLSPKLADLQQWREGFAHELRRLGVQAEATPRQARGHVPKAEPVPVKQLKQRGTEPLVQKAQRQTAEREARAPQERQPRHWSQDIQERQEAIRRAYLTHADELSKGDASERQLARDIRRFVADMPVPLTRQQALGVALRQVLEQHPGRPAVAAPLPSVDNAPTRLEPRPALLPEQAPAPPLQPAGRRR